MRIVYLLLSPTFGMHQYTADMANRMAAAGNEVHLVTSAHYPEDRYASSVRVHPVARTRDRGLTVRALQPRAVARVVATLRDLHPDVVHITGPHLWNLAIMPFLRKRRIPLVHTIHDVEPHPGTRYGPLLHLWNRAVLRGADHVLVHGEGYAEQLRRRGFQNVSFSRILHLFLGIRWYDGIERLAAEVTYEPQVLFFGRIERYKGVRELLEAWRSLGDPSATLVIAGKGDLSALWRKPLPPSVDLRNRLIDDPEALDLFRRSAVVVLPYTGASQSALVGAAYFFRKPVIVTRSGALAEYVEDRVMGWVVEPGDPEGLAAALREALDEPARLVRMGAAGRAWYDAQRLLEEEHLSAMYRQLAGCRQPAPTEADLASGRAAQDPS